MKKGIIFGLFLSIIWTFNLQAQDCDSIYRVTENYIVNSDDGRAFVSDGQVYTAFLDNERAEFNTTLYGNTVYRIAASAGTKDDYAIFTIRDMEDNILFTNKDHLNNPYWDFKIESTVPVKVQTELDTNKKITGCIVMMIGFLK
ncbi:hypothetical protein CW751_03775 [Brumimicrobium salinarum]|uniref:Uncharacterized protein n=1 Tax=Brumimicrobium salinarum TaxID=2058658 RepID=A0A2I0R522_9FLAO|nr:hypothetical protein [Brumimicrobium salinarum]PKR81655.1 hypothetical protein CW751_03775 [Brumimicrobium salinarum]